jgi:glycosyltransferase involved in cell wall biosynthesis
LRIGVDARALTGYRGVSRYTRTLLETLAREYPQDEFRLFVPGHEPLPAAAALRSSPNVAIQRHPLPGRVLFGAAAVARRPRLDRLLGDPEVIWAPTVAPLALSTGTPLVLTVQDLSFELRPHDFTGYERLWHALARPRALARRARLVIVLAEPTRHQLVARWGLSAAAVRVVPAGVREEGEPGVAEPADPNGTLGRFGLSAGSYLLAVGALEPRKAPLLLSDAFARARRRGLGAELAFAGEGRLADRLSGPGVRLLGRVSDAELDALYSGAMALVMPSLLEGYGLPVREALARGTPAVISDLPVFGEELSGAVLRVPAGDEVALADALVRIAGDDALRARLARAGRPAVSGMTWTEAARRTRAVLAEAAGGGGAGGGGGSVR